ncbi:MAG: hypothetical protein HYW05_01615 [Candidatus Diapherotrites archaeon]|nr:hypothetical protein [Candidatus Diapherotrites archaeon]
MHWKLIIALVIAAIAIYAAYTFISRPAPDNGNGQSYSGQMAFGASPTKEDCSNQEYVPDAEYCWGLYARNSNNPEFCGEIISSGMKDLCYWNIAVQSGDKELCNSVEDADLRFDCAEAIDNK